jgi:hypothetical protein
MKESVGMKQKMNLTLLAREKEMQVNGALFAQGLHLPSTHLI